MQDYVLYFFVIILLTGIFTPIFWYFLKDKKPLISKGFLWKSTLVSLFSTLILCGFWFIHFWAFIVFGAIIFSFLIILFYLSILINRKNSDGMRTII